MPSICVFEALGLDLFVRVSTFQNRLWDELQSVRLRYVSKAIYLAGSKSLAGVLTWATA